jgi:prepilin-type N-terminal cleavage/methylation domain-containing protein
MFSDRLLKSVSDRRRPNPRAGFSLIEMLIVLAIIGVILTFAVPKLTVALRGSRETAAMKAVTTIHTAQVQYYSSYNRYAVSLQELGPPANGAEGAAAAGLIERDLASGDKGGYKYTVAPTPTGYTVTAIPSQYPTSGSVTYFSDQSMGIHIHKGQEPATVNDPLLGETAPAQQQSK